MTVTHVHRDPENLTLRLEAQLDVTAERAWQLWADPRQLERWWGPPTHPATFTVHELVPGGVVRYYMTGPEGEGFPGLWQVVEVQAPRRLAVEDLFADENGNPAEGMPVTRMTVEITDRPGGVTMAVTSRFPDLASMEQVVAMGAVEGMQQAMGQIAAILAEG
jgi:uncharacterized protein YndB with AHSA1/START domain